MSQRFAVRTGPSLSSGLAALFLGAALVALHDGGMGAQSSRSIQGEWQTVSVKMPINPVHLALLHTGKVLIVAGSGNVATERDYQAAVADPQTGSIVTQPLAWDMFCNGMVILADGRPLINGGTLQYDPFHGEPRNAVFDPITETFADVQSMAHGRWYPTVTMLGDGRVMTFSGLLEGGGTNTTVEIYTPGVGWSPEYPAGWTPPLYPRLHLLPDGRVLYSGSSPGSRIFDPSTHTWTGVVASTNYAGVRKYGTSVLLPLKASKGYAAKVLILGGGNPATNTTEILDLSAASLRWQYGPPMSQARIEMNATILPSGKVLAMGGSSTDENAATASYNADLYDPDAGPTGAFTSAGANTVPRLYHSGSLLLPDATVLLVGGNPTRASYEQDIEIYSPAYLFTGDGSPAERPTITTVTPAVSGYGSTFHVQTPDAAGIKSVVLVRPGAQTHAFDMDQRLIELSYTAGAGDLTVTAPPNGNIAPPGYYMLFVLNNVGVPSVATFVRLVKSASNQPPTATITSPATDRTIDAGQSVSFSGNASDPDGTVDTMAWSFPGGTPSSATILNPGNVRYSTPGSYVASFTATDNNGASSPVATRSITVTNFSVAATPTSRTVSPGTATSYTTTVTGGTGFGATVTFSVSGLPAGASGTFTPAAVTGSGSSTLNVTTSPTTPAGSYPLTVRGTTGSLTRSVTVTLVVAVAGDFTLSVSPASRTINRGGKANYTVTIAAVQGFSGTVNLALTGVPGFATATFTPTSVANSGTSALQVNTNQRVARGTYTLTITGSSGPAVHSAKVTLVIQ
jgi:hypothetical protein